MTTSTKSRKEAWASDPVSFYREVFQGQLYQKQVDMLEAVRDNPQVAVVGCNGAGKDYVAGRLVAWWLATHHPAVCVCLAPTQRQSDIIWAELETAHLEAETSATPYALGGKLLDAQWKISPQHFAIQFSTDKPLRLQGYHSANLMVLVTEAHGLEQGYYDAVHRLQPDKLVLVGNPLCLSGEFYDAFHDKRDLWARVQIGAEDVPAGHAPGLITKKWVQARAKDWGEESPLYIASVTGQFPESLEDCLIPLSVVTAATKRTVEASGPVIIACDVARFGSDETIILQRKGNVAKVLQHYRGQDLMRTVGALKAIWDDIKPEHLVVDAVGIGAGVVDRLKELRVPVTAFSGGSSPRGRQGRERFLNRVAQAWWEMRDWFLSGEVDIPNDPTLIAQVSGRKYEIMSDKKIKLESKDRMPRSPDRADALAMTFMANPPVQEPSVIDLLNPPMVIPAHQEHLELLYGRGQIPDYAIDKH